MKMKVINLYGAQLVHFIGMFVDKAPFVLK